MKTNKILIIVIICTTALFGCTKKQTESILISENASQQEVLAAKEIRRYVYQRTGELLEISKENSENVRFILKTDTLLANEEFKLKTDKGKVVISGGSDLAKLYGAYEFAEQLGIRFYLHGDVVPDKQIPFVVSVLDIHKKPAFKLRGILPFHDFPEGPDWWDEADYKTVFYQLVKMKMNFAGFHTYPEQNQHEELWYRAEPLVWIGDKKDVKADGTVLNSYPMLHFTTGNSAWGYRKKPTSEFTGGAAQIFEKDDFGLSYMDKVSAWPHTHFENLNIANESGKFFNNVFSFAKKLDIKICVGTEAPLTIPNQVKENYSIEKKTEEVTRRMYEGMFNRIQKTYPADYYWLWTPESWTWHADKVSDKQVENTLRDIQIAHEVLKDMGNPMQLASCGWVLGPPKDRTQFDRDLPKDMPFSCINRGQGYSPVDKSFAMLKGRPKWSIPWVEDDPDMISAQLWVGRLRKDALDSYKYGCDGLMGIHWRTKVLAPNFSALAKAAWEADDWQNNTDERRELPAMDFYRDFVKSEFGTTDDFLTKLFVNLDGKGVAWGEGMYGDAPLKATDWDQGPGAIGSARRDSLENKRKFLPVYDFISELESYKEKLKGAGNLDRLDYWVNTFKFNKSLVELGVLKLELDSLISTIHNVSPENQKRMVKEVAVPKRIILAQKWNEAMTYLLQKTSTKGDMGIIANMEMHNLNLMEFLSKHDKKLEKVLGEKLPSAAFPAKDYTGKSRIIVTAAPSVLYKGDSINLKVRVLSEHKEIAARMFFRPLGEKGYSTIDLAKVGRNVFEVIIDENLAATDFEYYFEVQAGNDKVAYPATAKEINQSIVIMN
jgi:hypothetical protein